MFLEISTIVCINFNHSSLHLCLMFYLSFISTPIKNLKEYSSIYYNISVS